MSKLVYPETGLMTICRGNINRCAEYLSSAIAGCSFDVPAGFGYRGYLNGLGGKLSGYRSECQNIGAKVKNTDRNFAGMSDNFETSVSRINISRITKRERLIR